MAETDVVGKYLQVRQERDRAGAQLKTMGEFLTTLGRALTNDPIRVMLANAPDFSAPAEIAMGRSVPSLDWRGWPEKESVSRLLREYYDIEFRCRNAYSAIPHDQQRLIAGP